MPTKKARVPKTKKARVPKTKKARVPKTKKVRVPKTKKVAEGAEVPQNTETKSEAPLNQVRFEVLVNDLHFKTDAPSLPDAIEQFLRSPEFPAGAIKTKVVVRLGTGDAVQQKVWQSAIARRIFSNLNIKPELIELFSEKISRRFL